MPKKEKINEWKKQRRMEFIESRKYRYYIFCEGEKTEPQYFEGFRNLIDSIPMYREMVMIHIERGVGETLYILNKAKEYVKNNNISNSQIWCVYDKDDFPADRFDQVASSINELNRIPKDGVYYHAAWSNQCIEFWFLLHFSYYQANNERKLYIEYLDKKFREFGYKKYQKNMTETFSILQKYGSVNNAITYAKRIINESSGKKPSEIAPGTTVYELVEELYKYISYN